MPDYWTIYLLLIAAGFGGIVGFIIGAKFGRKTDLQKLWDNNEKVVIEIQSIENKLSGNQKTSFNNPSQITFEMINKEILNNYDRLKEISQKIKKDKLLEKDVKKPTITHHSSLEEKEVVQTEDTSNEISISHYYSQDELFSNSDQQVSRKPDMDLGNLASQLVNLYNRGVDDRTARNEFWEKFSITRIGNNNAVAQRMGEVSEPDFRESGSGDFLAVQNDDNQTYLVVPLFDTTITSSTYNEGGIGFAFDCQNYNPQSAYSVVKVGKPALFKQEGERWFLVENGKGELRLQN